MVSGMNVRDKIEAWFEGYGAWVCRRRGFVILFSLLIFAALACGLPQLKIETSFEAYLPEDNPKKLLFREFQREYGSDERVLIILEPPEIYSLEFLSYLKALHQSLEEELPYVANITSLINVRRTYGSGDSLVSEDLMEQWPQTGNDLAVLKDRVAQNSLYQNWVISEDGKLAAIIIETDGSLTGDEFDLQELDAGFEDDVSSVAEAQSGELLTTQQITTIVSSLDRVLKTHSPADNVDLYLTGMPVFALKLNEMIASDVSLFIVISIVIIGALLFLLFRTIVGVIMPLLVVGFATITTVGAMGWVGIPLTAVTQILPSLLLAIGIGDAVHIIAMFYRHYNAEHDREAAVSFALGHSGLAVVMTSLTTAAGIATFNVTSLQPTIDLGRVGPFGVMMALFFSLLLLPALLALLPVKRQDLQSQQRSMQEKIDGFLLSLGRIGSSRPKLIIVIVALLWAVSSIGLSKLYFSQDDMSWFRDDNPFKVATLLINERLGGALPFEVIIDSGEENGLHNPALLKAMDEMQKSAEAMRSGEITVGQSFSIADIVKETHQALNDGDPEFHRIPDQRELVSQELLLFENGGSDALEDVSDSSFRSARIMFTVPFVDALNYPRFGREVKHNFEQILAQHQLDKNATVTIGGFLTLAGETFELLFISMARSYGLAFVLVSIFMVILIGQIRLGLLSLIPNLTPIVIVLGVMGLLDMPLDISSMLLGGILIGIAVDDTIHFVHNYHRYQRQSLSISLAIEKTLLTTGRAMLVTSIVLTVGFFIYTAAELKNIVKFGAICGVGVILAFLADVIMMPALVTLLDAKKEKSAESN